MLTTIIGSVVVPSPVVLVVVEVLTTIIGGVVVPPPVVLVEVVARQIQQGQGHRVI